MEIVSAIITVKNIPEECGKCIFYEHDAFTGECTILYKCTTRKTPRLENCPLVEYVFKKENK